MPEIGMSAGMMNKTMLVVAVGAAMVLLLTASVPATAMPTCGLEQLAQEQRGKQRVRRSSSGLQPSVHPAFHFPSEDEPSNDLLPGKCTVEDEVVNLFGVGNSECYSPEVTRQYGQLQSWPHTTAKVAVKTITADNGVGLITQEDVDFSLGLLNTSFADAGISFAATSDFVASQSVYDSMISTEGYTTSRLFEVLEPLAALLGIDTNLSTRDVHSYIVVLKLDASSFVGLCIPDSGMLAARPQELKDASGLPDWAGNICFVDYRWFATPSLNPNATALSNGLYTIHEMGHSLGLLHTFQAAAYRFPSSGCQRPSYVDSSCFATKQSYVNGDYAADTAVMVSSTVHGPGNPTYDNQTCEAGPFYPFNCDGSSFFGLDDTDTNYMSYVPESCYDTFSAEQIGRMRCTIDRFAHSLGGQRIRENRAYPPVLARATFEKKKQDFILVEWLPPMNLLDTSSNTVAAPSNLRFILERSPAFGGGAKTFDSSTYSFMDTDVVPGDLTSYSYRVTAEFAGEMGAQAAFVTAGRGAASIARASAAIVVALAVAATVLISL